MYSKKWTEWLATPACGEKIDGTPFISFKAPLQNDQRFEPSQRFNFGMLFHKHPNIGLIIDLTPSTKYYNPEILKSFNVEHKKIPVAGFGTIPTFNEVKQFTEAVDDFRSRYPHRDIGVHCFHGLNRTGLMVCLYLIKRFRYRPDAAIEAFNSARGKGIEREIYINFLMNRERPSKRRRIDYRNSKTRSGREMPRNGIDTNWRIPSNSHSNSHWSNPQTSRPPRSSQPDATSSTNFNQYGRPYQNHWMNTTSSTNFQHQHGYQYQNHPMEGWW